MSPAFNRTSVPLALALMWMANPAAHAGDTVPIIVTNDDTDDILVTVYDMNAHSAHSKAKGA